MAYEWITQSARYRDTDSGAFLSAGRLRQHVDDSLKASADTVAALADMLADGDITAAQWRTMMRDEIKKEYIRMGVLGSGGVEQMTQSRWGSVGGSIADQYRYLENFYEQIQDGNLTAGQIKQRLAPLTGATVAYDDDRQRSVMYANSARESYERMFSRSAENAGAAFESWELGASAKHCNDCLAFAGEGQKPLAYFPYPGGGDTVCRTNCNCYKRYFDAAGRAIN